MTKNTGKHSWLGAFPVITGPWLGQTPPTATPIEFAPEILDTDKMSFGTVFNPRGDEFFFGYQRGETDKIHDIRGDRHRDEDWWRYVRCSR